MTKKIQEFTHPSVVLGCAIGDAMGMPFEQLGVRKHEGLKDWKGGYLPGTHHKLPSGHWTDDTEMTIELANSLTNNGKFDGEDVAAHYLAWSEDTPHGMGGTVRQAMANLKISGLRNWRECGVGNQDPEEVGSGTVMRCGPIGVFYCEHPDMLRYICKRDAEITHRSPEAYAASLAVTSLITGVIKQRNERLPAEWRKWSSDFMISQLEAVLPDTLTTRAIKKAVAARSEVDPEGFADTYSGRFGSAWQIASTAIYCALTYWTSFEMGIRKAIELGGDTDTRGAVVGAILGAKFGLAIPEHLIEGLKDAGELIIKDKQLWEARPR